MQFCTRLTILRMRHLSLKPYYAHRHNRFPVLVQMQPIAVGAVTPYRRSLAKG